MATFLLFRKAAFFFFPVCFKVLLCLEAAAQPLLLPVGDTGYLTWALLLRQAVSASLASFGRAQRWGMDTNELFSQPRGVKLLPLCRLERGTRSLN